MSTLLTEMDLPVLPAETAAFAADPVSFVEEARRTHPWLAKSDIGGYIVHGYESARDIIGMDEETHPFYPGLAKFYDAEHTEWGRFISSMMNAVVGEKHHRLRKSVQSAFTPKVINRYRGVMQRVISELLDEWVPRGKFDFAAFAADFPITVFCGLLGVSCEVVPRIRDALEAQTASVSLNRDLRASILAAFEVLWDFADSAIREREALSSDTDGLIDTMLRARAAGMIDDVEMRQNLIMFAAGGYDTSKNMLALLVRILMERPELWQRCAKDVDFCRKAVNEGLRHSGISTVYRSVVQDFDYRGVRFPRDTMLILMVSMAGRDPSYFTDPQVFDPERANANQHVAFGRGEHFCIGMHLARTQIEEGLHLVTQRLHNPRLAGEVTWRPYLGVWGLKTLPIEFDQA
ncbi:MAG: cytochrome P450 [Rhizobiaceae bacterium]|nr:MAG: cytochrome P450 [Rhizobiaceae bacterium]